MVTDLIHAILDSIKSAYVHHRIIDHVKQFFCVRAQDRGGEWRFQTKRQVWILKHLYSQNVIDKTFFKKLVLPYISTLYGGAKEVSKRREKGYSFCCRSALFREYETFLVGKHAYQFST